MTKLETITLDNGLKIYLYNDKRRHSTFFQFSTFCGGLSKHFMLDGKEYMLQDGVSHILEHYIVECNEKGNFLNELGSYQMNTNASTAFNNTSYYFETVENVLLGIRTILEGVNNVKFDKDKLEKLKNPIYQEIRGRLDNKFYHLNRMNMKNIFNDINFVDVGGEIDEVEKTTIDDLKSLYDAFYKPDNQFIVIAGNFNKKEVLEEINDYYNTHKIEVHDSSIIKLNETNSVRKKKDILYFPTPMEYTELTFKIDISKYKSEELLDLEFYLNSFYTSSFGVTSNLYKYLVDNKIIIDSIVFGFIKIDNFLVLSIGSYNNNPDVFTKKVLEEINNCNNLDKEKFELDKKSTIIRLILRDENIFKMIMPFINNIVIYDYPYLDSVKDIERLNYDDYVKTIKNVDFSNYIEVTIKNKE